MAQGRTEPPQRAPTRWVICRRMASQSRRRRANGRCSSPAQTAVRAAAWAARVVPSGMAPSPRWRAGRWATIAGGRIRRRRAKASSCRRACHGDGGCAPPRALATRRVWRRYSRQMGRVRYSLVGAEDATLRPQRATTPPCLEGARLHRRLPQPARRVRPPAPAFRPRRSVQRST